MDAVEKLTLEHDYSVVPQGWYTAIKYMNPKPVKKEVFRDPREVLPKIAARSIPYGKATFIYHSYAIHTVRKSHKTSQSLHLLTHIFRCRLCEKYGSWDDVCARKILVKQSYRAFPRLRGPLLCNDCYRHYKNDVEIWNELTDLKTVCNFILRNRYEKEKNNRRSA